MLSLENFPEAKLAELYEKFQILEIFCNNKSLDSWHSDEYDYNLVVLRCGEFRHFLDCHYYPIGNNVVECLEAKGSSYFRINRYDEIRVIGWELVGCELRKLDEIFASKNSVLFQKEIDFHKGIQSVGEEVWVKIH